jgi:outer membrane lipoprotein-sorting protein
MKPLRSLKLLILGLPLLTGCLVHTHQLPQPKSAGPALDEGVAQLISGVNDRYNAIQTLSATVNFSAQIGGAKRGKETDTTSFGGYILLRKPNSLRVLGLVPVLRTHAFDLASDGSTFKLYIPVKNKAIVGLNTVTSRSANPIENLRPDVFIDSILVPSIEPDRLVYLTTGDVLTGTSKTQVSTPEYNLHVMTTAPQQDQPAPAHIIQVMRIIHFDRTTLLPDGQDLYNTAGAVETRVRYGPYQHFGNALYPGVITIERPLEEYQITISITKLTLNQTLNDEQFQLTIPANVPTQQLK